ncbi:25S rRNA (adenine645-N1)-methyltransferase [Scheffersomyces spartinae]|uniref:Ribosomal RNA-processing protein 8 n=1 Tax=Scheffersomyces spartinae TaxID=45513 RepID=A0A9P7V586_9ASCO|nr:25S rRNA (adenine645-N1)-methyltransferase [Scheffersomyces spartinae]KAG7191401.1 25S rRNA (adenine645-N1)-methyltransferase [Scheffersomyces spartinae]
MALFEVDGWDLKSKTVAFSDGGVLKNRKERKEKKKQALKERWEKKRRGDEQPEEQQPEVKRQRSDDRRKGYNKEEARSDTKVEAGSTGSTLSAPPPVTPTSDTKKLSPLQQKMMAKLSGSRFRWINEQLYTISSESALDLVKKEPSLFQEYHQGFRSQVQSWPENPVDVFVDQIKTRGSLKPINAPGGLPGFQNRQVVIADMGCGEAQLALDVNNFVKQYNAKNSSKKNSRKPPRRNVGPSSLDIKVHSFDLQKANDRITVADIKNVPLPDRLCNIVIFCLALMGTNFLDFIKEAYRLLAPRGELWIAEIKSRFSESGSKTKEDQVGEEFVNALKLCGFFHKATDNSNKMFTRFEFFKAPQEILDEKKAKLERKKKFIEHESEKEELESKREKVPEGEWLLKPCIYKRR